VFPKGTPHNLLGDLYQIDAITRLHLVQAVIQLADSLDSACGHTDKGQLAFRCFNSETTVAFPHHRDMVPHGKVSRYLIEPTGVEFSINSDQFIFRVPFTLVLLAHFIHPAPDQLIRLGAGIDAPCSSVVFNKPSHFFPPQAIMPSIGPAAILKLFYDFFIITNNKEKVKLC